MRFVYHKHERCIRLQSEKRYFREVESIFGKSFAAFIGFFSAGHFYLPNDDNGLNVSKYMLT